MKKTIFSIALSIVMAVPALAQEHGTLVEQFQHNKQALNDLVHDLTPEQWNFKPAADRWSIAEIVEHITVAEQFTLMVLKEQLMEQEVTNEGREMAAGFEQQISATLADRSQKFQAPENVEPTGRWSGGAEVMSVFGETRNGMIDFLQSAAFDLRTRKAHHPVLGTDVDASGWATISVQHCMRHMQQIEEVMAVDGFPAKSTR